MPEQVIFTRSDHYNFVRIGVPVVVLYPGIRGPGAAAQRDYFTHHYHQPSDDLSLPFNWPAAYEFAKLNYQVAKPLADAPDRPRWLKGDYFGERYRGPMTEQ
jgi:hypothetical protein